MDAVRWRARRRWWIASVVLVVAGLVIVPTSASAEEDREVTFSGSGWGHAVGMSQYGAYGRALAGQTHQQILAAYYQGSSIGSLGSAGIAAVDEVFVNVASDQTVNTVSILDGPAATTTGVIVSRSGATPKTLQNGQSFTITDTLEFDNGGCRVVFSDGTEWPVGPCGVEAGLADGGGAPAHLVQLATCRGTSCTFGWGTRLLFVDNANHDPGFPGFDAVVQIATDDYVRGIGEVPYSWPAEVLETQAIAARSYAASRSYVLDQDFGGHEAQTCYCDVRNDSFDQVYAGWVGGKENSSAWDLAATSTASQVVTHPAAPGGIVRAYYSSSNGGASESSKDKWGGDLAYLVSVDDPWSLTAANPYASWVATTSASEVASWLGLTELAGVSVVARNDSGSPRTFEFAGFDGSGKLVEVTRHVESVRARFGLRSWFFSISVDHARVGVHDPRTGIWHLRDENGSVSSFYYGNPHDIPYVGDWDGDGDVTVGLYRQSTGFLFLRNSNTQGIADIQIFYGNPGDLPIAGDWDGDGVETVGIFRPSEARFYLRNSNTQGTGDLSFAFGEPGDVPIAGDWDGDGIDTVGLYRPSNETLYLMNDLAKPKADLTWVYGGASAGDRIIAGDWNADGIDTVGLFRPSEATFYLRDGFAQASANIVFEMGESFMTPIAGW